MELTFAQIARLPVLTPGGRSIYGREQVLEEALGKLLAGVRQAAGAEPDVALYGNGTTCEQIAGELANLSLLGAGKGGGGA